MNDETAQCKSFKFLKSIGITTPCEWCFQHVRHIHDIDSYDAIVECVGDDGITRQQRFNGRKIQEIEAFAIDRYAEIMIRFNMKRLGQNIVKPDEEEIRRYVRYLLAPCCNFITGDIMPSRWQMMPHFRKCFARLPKRSLPTPSN